MIRIPLPARSRDRLYIVAIWTVLLGFAWSLPVISYVRMERERALVDSGHYYTPKMPAQWYMARD